MDRPPLQACSWGSFDKVSLLDASRGGGERVSKGGELGCVRVPRRGAGGAGGAGGGGPTTTKYTLSPIGKACLDRTRGI